MITPRTQRRFCAWRRPLACSACMAAAVVLAGCDRFGMPTDVLPPGADAAPTTPADARAPVTAADSGLLDVHVRDTELAAVLETLSYEARANIVTSTKVTGRVSANLYDVTLTQALDALLIPNGFAYVDTGSQIFVGTPEEVAALRPPPATRVFWLRYLPPKDAASAIKAVLSKNATVVESAQVEGGGFTSAGDAQKSKAAGEDYLIVTDYGDRLAAAERLLAELDVRPQQVLIEATILRATLNETNEFGVDFTMLGGVDFEAVGSTSTASANLRTGPLPPDQFQETTFNINTDFAGNVGEGGFTFGLINNSIAGFVRALEQVTDVVVVANPKIVALNKHETEIIVGRRDGYLTTTVTETAAVQQVEFLETGTQIKFRPIINGDGTVRLSVHPKDSNGGLSAANLPFEETTEARTDIIVANGKTVLIGGLFRERTVRSRRQIPVLGNIPWVGELFGSTSDQSSREEVIILLTVHIIEDTDAEQARYEQLLDDIERVRVGSRRGLMGTGRERLAQAFYREALRQLDRGDTERALLNARMALTNRPTHLAAIKLKERLLGERELDYEGSRMRTFIRALIGQPESRGDGPLDEPRPPAQDAQPEHPVDDEEGPHDPPTDLPADPPGNDAPAA